MTGFVERWGEIMSVSVRHHTRGKTATSFNLAQTIHALTGNVLTQELQRFYVSVLLDFLGIYARIELLDAKRTHVKITAGARPQQRASVVSAQMLSWDQLVRFSASVLWSHVKIMGSVGI